MILLLMLHMKDQIKFLIKFQNKKNLFINKLLFMNLY